jgi:inner membrane transporter RhtA
MSLSETRRADAAGIALMTGSAASNQFGAAIAALAFPVLGPAGVVAVRQWVAAAVLLATVRPKFTAFTRAQWRAVLALALVFGTMNLTLYFAIDRIGLGLAVTLEFLGPLSVALLASRRALDLACALVAAAGVLVLARPQATADYAGIALALAAAACWAAYIHVNRLVGARVAGADGPATAAGVSALLYVPVGIWVLTSHPVTAAALGRAAVAGLLCSALPMVLDLLALRRVGTRFFGVFMSVHPVFAAVIGLVILRQALALPDWLAIGLIVSANAVSVSRGGQAAVEPSEGGTRSASPVSAGSAGSSGASMISSRMSPSCGLPVENMLENVDLTASIPECGVTFSETNAAAPVGIGSQKLTIRQPSTPSVATLLVTPKPTSSSGVMESTTPRPPGVSGSAPATLAMP